MSSFFALRGVLARINPLAAPTTTKATHSTPARAFSTTPACPGRNPTKRSTPGSGPGTGKRAAPRRSKQVQRSEHYARVKVLKQNMFSPAPPPLRMARLRYLRHWTVHRAWQLFRRQQHDATARERSRMHAGMYNACEELRRTAGPGSRGEGYLYRVAMEKKNVYRADSVPIEYARLQTDSPAKEAWDHSWTR